MIKNVIGALAGVAALGAGAASASVLDFQEIAPSGVTYVGGTTATLSNATINNLSGADLVFLSDRGANGSFCGVTELGGINCSNWVEILFDEAVSNLRFGTSAHGGGDATVATLFDDMDNELAQFTFTADEFADFTGITGIARVVLDGRGSGALGHTYNDFTFDTQAIPVPAAALLFVPALAALRRKRAA
ncbi:MAG: hypothetical protein HRU11_04025 [Parvularculaceae bacterium]|nr:hypothetical protein [Parvularculaceae bacterium]